MPDRSPIPARRPDGLALNAAFETARLRIEPLAARHAAGLHDGLRDPRIYEWISALPPLSDGQLAERWARVEREALADPALLDLGWAVQRTSDGAWIGKLDAEVREDGVATNVGYLFLPASWGRGYASEAVSALCAHLQRHGVVRQVATVTAGNEASCRVLARAGFARTRVLPGNDTIRGEPVDDVEFVRGLVDPPA